MNKHNLSERDICTKCITPALEQAGWDIATQVREEFSLTKGRVIVRGKLHTRAKHKRADYVLFYKPNIPIAIIEAKDNKHSVGDGMQQALGYAEMLQVPFVFSSNGDGFLFHNKIATDGVVERELGLNEFPASETLWQWWSQQRGLDEQQNGLITQDYYSDGGDKTPRYYQLLAINKTIEAIAQGQNRILLVMATGTGKTFTAFQIIWRLWKSRSSKRILFLADRNILVDQTMTNDFKPFGSAMTKIQKRQANKSYEIYLSLYQAVTGSEEEKNIYKQFSPGFFDLIVVDECHRGSAAADSAWREILEYFSSATQIGLTATPKETKAVSNIDYFGDPIYTYSLRQGIDDGFLAPYKVVRIDMDRDLQGWRPDKGMADKYGNEIEDRVYNQKDFDKSLVLEKRTQRVAEKVSEFLKQTNRIDQLMARCDALEELRKQREEKRLAVHAAAIKQLLDTSSPQPLPSFPRRRESSYSESLDSRLRGNDSEKSCRSSDGFGFIQQHFSELYRVKGNVAELRKAILQLAVMGRLVPQDLNDPPASELLKEIQAEKERISRKDAKTRRKAKALPPIKPEEVPYELPQGWEWVRLGEIGLINPRNNAEDLLKVGFVPMPMIPEGYSEKHQFEERSWSEIKKGYTHFADGDVGMAKITPCFENAKSCIFSGLPNGIGAGTTELHVFRNAFNSVIPRFLLYYLKNPHYISKAVPNMTGSAGQKRIPTPYFAEQLFSLPPLSEQHRIVTKIDQLMALCDSLEKQIDATTSKQGELLNALVHQLSSDRVEPISLSDYRLAVSGYAVQKMADSPSFGRTALAKVIYLAQAHVGLDLQWKPERQAAGPLDTWIYSFEEVRQSKGLFDLQKIEIKADQTKVEYRPLQPLAEVCNQALRIMSKWEIKELDRLLQLLKSKRTEEVEIITTLFAAWNDLLMDGLQPDEQQIITEVRENWHEKKRRFTPDTLRRWVGWLRDNNLVPQGRGPHTQQQRPLAL